MKMPDDGISRRNRVAKKVSDRKNYHEWASIVKNYTPLSSGFNFADVSRSGTGAFRANRVVTVA